MFGRMLRPSRRHVHERISQNEVGVDGSNTNATTNNNGGDNTTAGTIDEGGGPSIVVIGSGGDENIVLGGGGGTNTNNNNQQSQEHDLNLLEGGIAPDGGVDEAISSQPTTAASAGDTNSSTPLNPQNQIGNASSSSDEDDDEEGALQPNPTTHPFLTSQIQTERELRYRRQTTCTLLILFFLTRLWIEAIIEKDVGLIFLSMMGTTWTYRWFVTRREAEEEYDRQIMEGERNISGESGTSAVGAGDGEGSGADAAVNFDPDLGLMSFQAQLALAILESQRQMFENGGYGGNDRTSHDDGPGVTSEAKGKWKSYEWGNDAEETATLAGLTRTQSMEAIKRSGSAGSNYGSVSTVDILDDENEDQEEKERLSPKSSPTRKQLEATGGLLSFDENDEEPSCSICLCEYEHKEKVVRLPCDHIYHESCLNSWTQNHVRCPLCNYDLMEGFEQPASVQQARQHAEEQRAFRSMALSTLGRRIRTRRRSTTAARRAAERRLAAATADDSIV